VSRRGWLLFAAMCVIWGAPYLMIKVAVQELSPATLVLARMLLAAALLLPVAAARGQVRPVLSRWKPLLAFTAVEMCVPWLLLSEAERHLSSSLTGLLIAAVPLVGAVLARAGGHERLDGRRVLGLAVGVAGVGALVGFDVGGGDLWAVLAVAVVVICYAVGPFILARSLADLPDLGVVAVSLFVGAVVYLPLGLAQLPATVPSAPALASVAGLAVLCTAVAFLVFFALIAEVGPARATVITFVNPAVAVVLGVVFLREPFTLTTAVGFLLILAGSVLATRRAAVPPATAPVPPATAPVPPATAPVPPVAGPVPPAAALAPPPGEAH
jgi:drug/metabolite transporter (DMT)-like permease